MFGENPFLAFLGIFLVGPMVLAALLRLGLRRLGWRSTRWLNIVLGIWIALGYLFVIALAVLISKYDIYLAGYSATSFWVMLTMASVGFAADFAWPDGIGRFMMPVVSGFAIGVSALFGFIHFDDNRHSLRYEDDHYRIEDTQWGFGPSRFTLFVNHGFYDQGYSMGDDIPAYEFTKDRTRKIAIASSPGFLTVRLYLDLDSLSHSPNPRVILIGL